MNASHKEDLQHDLEGGNGIQRMLFECRFEMSEGELRRLPRRNLRRLAQGGQGGADRALSSVESLPDAVRRGFAQPALEASERLEFIAGEDGLSEKLPQTVGIQKQSFDFIGSPNAERSSAAGSPTSITTEDTPRADRFPAQMLLGHSLAKSRGGSGIQLVCNADTPLFSACRVPHPLPPRNDRSSNTRIATNP